MGGGRLTFFSFSSAGLSCGLLSRCLIVFGFASCWLFSAWSVVRAVSHPTGGLSTFLFSFSELLSGPACGRKRPVAVSLGDCRCPAFSPSDPTARRGLQVFSEGALVDDQPKSEQ